MVYDNFHGVVTHIAYDDDANFTWHHRILLSPLDGVARGHVLVDDLWGVLARHAVVELVSKLERCVWRRARELARVEARAAVC